MAREQDNTSDILRQLMEACKDPSQARMLNNLNVISQKGNLNKGGSAPNSARSATSEESSRVGHGGRMAEGSATSAIPDDLVAIAKRLQVCMQNPSFFDKVQNLDRENQSSKEQRDIPMSSSVIAGSGRKFSEPEKSLPVDGRKFSVPENFRPEDVFKNIVESRLERQELHRETKIASPVERPCPVKTSMSEDSFQRFRTSNDEGIWKTHDDVDWRNYQENEPAGKVFNEDRGKDGQGNVDLLDRLLASKRSTNIYGFSEEEENNSFPGNFSSAILSTLSGERSEGSRLESSSNSANLDVALDQLLREGKLRNEHEKAAENYMPRSLETDPSSRSNADLAVKIGHLEAELQNFQLKSRERELFFVEMIKQREKQEEKLKEVLVNQVKKMSNQEKDLREAYEMANQNSQALKQSEDSVKKLQDIVTQQHNKMKQYDETLKRFQSSNDSFASRLQNVEKRLKQIDAVNQNVKDCCLESQDLVKSMMLKYDSSMFRIEHNLVARAEKSLQQGSFSWAPAFGESLMRCIEGSKMPPYIESPHFQFPDSNGITIVFEAYPCGYGKGRRTHLSVFWRILPSENDKNLKWPFKGKVTFTLLPVIAEARPVFFTTMIHPRARAFQKPVTLSENDVTDGWGCQRFITRECALSPMYFKNNQLEFNVKIELE